VKTTNPYYNSPHWRALRAACFARDHGMCTVPGCTYSGVVADHIIARPNVSTPCDLDRLDNLRLLCRSHDSQVREVNGQRKQGGKFKVKGCTADGLPLDPERRWKR
jgi:5-methylcytosine-specific restriction endonuclease McrA